MHVAEQVSIERRPDEVIALLGQRPATWLQPFLLLAWNEGEAALHRLRRVPLAGPGGRGALGAAWGGADEGAAADADRDGAVLEGKCDHQLRLSEAVAKPAGTTSFAMVWTVDSARVLFRRLRGELVVEPFDVATVLGLRASCMTKGEPGLPGTAQRPIELVVRSLLGHIRTAVE